MSFNDECSPGASGKPLNLNFDIKDVFGRPAAMTEMKLVSHEEITGQVDNNCSKLEYDFQAFDL